MTELNPREVLHKYAEDYGVALAARITSVVSRFNRGLLDEATAQRMLNVATSGYNEPDLDLRPGEVKPLPDTRRVVLRAPSGPDLNDIELGL